MLATHSRGIPSPRRSPPQPLILLPNTHLPPRFKARHRRSTKNTTMGQTQSPPVSGLARGVGLVRWTLLRGYSLGRLTIPGSGLPRHAKNAVPARPRSVVLSLSPNVIVAFFLTKGLYGSYSVQASTRHASGAKHEVCHALTLQNVACAGPTNRSSHRTHIKTGRILRPREGRKLENGPPPCPLPHVGDH